MNLWWLTKQHRKQLYNSSGASGEPMRSLIFQLRTNDLKGSSGPQEIVESSKELDWSHWRSSRAERGEDSINNSASHSQTLRIDNEDG